jgi:hypothetical protein
VIAAFEYDDDFFVKITMFFIDDSSVENKYMGIKIE